LLVKEAYTANANGSEAQPGKSAYDIGCFENLGIGSGCFTTCKPGCKQPGRFRKCSRRW
jgi:hypothetical protein